MRPYRISELAKKYVEYDMIQAHTELPTFPDSRIRLLYAFLSHNPPSERHSELYSLVTSLVQMGMDTHDTIDTDLDKRPENEMRSRQLKVLAGDYFSSRFYQLLSQAGQMDMISRISEAVCEVNRLKVNLYMKMQQVKLTAEDYLSQSVQVRSELFQVFTSVLEGKLSRIWPELLSGLSRCEVVLEELQRSDSPESFHGSWAYWHIWQVGTEDERRQLELSSQEPAVVRRLLEKYEIKGQLAAKLRSSVEGILSIGAKLDSDKLLHELRGTCDLFQRKLASVPAL
ncbi:heptaprenyl diphosphate synthase component 1 [Paenibacillus sp. GCM10023252]|uniref:heptaprenyl diphosphate synthase component 1 n=1 Tax=Paenibacillus sp. GCM10023252 TaxID=3252649 RepID=UPI0036211F67